MGLKLPKFILPKWLEKKLKVWWNRSIMKDYPITAVIRSKRQGGYYCMIDYLKRIDARSYLGLLSGTVFESPRFDQVSMFEGGASFIELFNPEPGVYIPTRFSEADDKATELIADTMNYVNWAKDKYRELRIMKYRSKSTWWQEYKEYIGLIFIGLAIMFIFYGGAEYWKQMDSVVSSLRGVVDSINTLKDSGTVVGG